MKYTFQFPFVTAALYQKKNFEIKEAYKKGSIRP